MLIKIQLTMKKILTLIAGIVITGTAMAQSPVTQGNFIIDGYAGIPNWANSLLYNQYDPDQTTGEQSNVSNYKVNGSMLSYGGRFEYMVAENLGIGVDVNYEVSGFNFDYDDAVYDTVSMTYSPVAMNYDYKAKKLRAMFRLNYHFVQNDRVDAYTGFGAGYKNVSRVAYEENKVTNERTEVDGPKALIPVTMRLAIGTRVYFTENIGAMVELGAFGGALLQFGLSAKF